MELGGLVALGVKFFDPDNGYKVKQLAEIDTHIAGGRHVTTMIRYVAGIRKDRTGYHLITQDMIYAKERCLQGDRMTRIRPEDIIAYRVLQSFE